MKKITLSIVFALIACVVVAQSTYKKVNLYNLSDTTINTLTGLGFDFRCGATITNNNVSIDVSNHELKLLDSLNISYHIEIENLEKFYQERAERDLPLAKMQLEQDKHVSASRKFAQNRIASSVNLDNYLEYVGNNEINWATPTNFNLGSMGGCLTVSETLSELDAMRALYPSLISTKLDASPTSQKTYGNSLGGTTWAGQTIHYVRITGNQSSPEGSKPQILFTSMIHAREVSSLMGNIFFMWYVLENYATNPAIKNLVDNNELYFIPIINPDGLKWNETRNPSGGGMQRKNLRPGANDGFHDQRGVDLNRNFDYFWGSAGSGSSGTPSSQSYRGPSPFSEPETQIVRDFVLGRNFQTVLMNHSYSNVIPHPYGGNPTFTSGREDEMHKMHEEMTRYNRYVSGATIFSASNGIADDWMLGGATDGNGSNGSGQNILATTPEHGAQGFWPSATNILAEAKRAVRIYLSAIYYGGKYAKLHDLTPNNIDALSSTLSFGVERVGQTPSNFTVSVTPVSANITSISTPTALNGMSILEQRTATATLQLNPSIAKNDIIEYNVKLANGDGVTFYDTNIKKYYQPDLLIDDNPDSNALTDNWNRTGNWTVTSADAFSGSQSIQEGASSPYASNQNTTLTTKTAIDLSSATQVIVQFYTKWDLERNFDFVEFQGSTNGSTWVTLNGKYNKPKSTSATNDHAAKSSTSENFQNTNASGNLYDGDRFDNWVMEEILIDASNNSSLFGATTAQFRFRFRTDGDNKPESYSTNYDGFFIDDFKVIGVIPPCAETTPTNVVANGITPNEATITWDNIPSATYDLRYRENGTATWTDVLDISTPTHTLTGLTLDTDYDTEVLSKCSPTAKSAYTPTLGFRTMAVSYCDSNGNNVSDEWIGNVTLGTLNNSSGASAGGYEDYTTTVAPPNLMADNSTNYTIQVTKAWSGTSYSEGVSVWIDFDKNGVFDNAEKVLNSTPNTTPTVSDNFTIPTVANIGTTRMRVSLKYSGTPDSCDKASDGNFDYGEVEDYTVNIVAPVCTETPPTSLIASAITQTEATISWDAIALATYDLRYKVSGTATWTNVNDLTSNTHTITGLTVDTTYDIEVRSKCSPTELSTYTASTFTTEGYCTANSDNDNFFYVNNVTLDGASNASTYDTGGYSDYTSTVLTDLTQGISSSISISKYDNTVTKYNTATAVWIDFNKDGTFDNTTERILNDGLNQISPVTGTFTVPISATLGTTRMRIVLRYNGTPNPCGNFNYGEVEDYTVNIIGASPEIQLTGNTIEIADGHTTPTTADHTDFETATIGSTVTRTFTINNTGGQVLNLTSTVSTDNTHFTITTAPNTTIAAGGTTTFVVTFTPTTATTETAIVTIANNDPDENPYTFTITAEGIPPSPEIVVLGNGIEIADGHTTPSTADDTDFQTINVGTTTTKTFTIENTGTAILNLTSAISIDNTHFTVTTAPNTTIGTGSATTFVITFTPTNEVAQNATVTIANDDTDENPYTFTITGNGYIPKPEIKLIGNSIEIADGHTTPSTANDTDFQTINVGTTATKTFTIENTGDATLNLTSVTSNNTHFTITTAPSTTVTAGNSTTFVVTFTPTNEIVQNATITIANDDADENPYTFTVTGNGFIPKPEIKLIGNGVEIADGHTTPSITDDTDFGNVGIGLEDTHTFTIENTGPGDLVLPTAPYVTIGDLTNFTLTTTPSDVISPSGATTFSIKFNPTVSGTLTTTVTIANNDTNENPYTFTITGNGVTPAPEMVIYGNTIEITDGATATSLTNNTNYGDCATTSAVNKQFIIENTGAGNLNLTGAAPYITLSNTTDFEVSIVPENTIAPTKSTYFFVAFKPSSTGVKTTTVTIANNDSDENPYTFTITGNGVTGYNESPGGVNNGLQLWLKANEGITATNGQKVTLWETQGPTGGGSDATSTITKAPTYKDNATDNVNFNPVVQLQNTSSSEQFMQGSNGFYTQDMFAVVIPDMPITNTGGNIMDLFCGDENPSLTEPDVTGFGFGNYSNRFSNEVIAFCKGTNGDYGVAQTSTATYTNAGIINTRNNLAGNGQELYYNGNDIKDTEVSSSSFGNVNDSRYFLGRSENFSANTNARYTEIITYSARKGDANASAERNKIMSYLAIKYGITLGVNGTSQDYVDTSGSTIWNQTANSGYNYDVTGIGRDDASGLNQKQSKSVNTLLDGTGETRGLITMGVTDIYSTNNENITTNSANTIPERTYLTWGNNNADLNSTRGTIYVDMSSGITGLSTTVEFTGILRTWKVVESGGDMPEVKLSIPASTVRNITPPGDFLMFVSDTPTFDTTAEYRILKPNGTNLETTFDFDGTKYITFGYAPQRKYDRSVYFDGVDDFISADNTLDINSSNGFTISAWIKRDGGSGLMSIASKRDFSFNAGYDFRINPVGKLQMTWTTAPLTTTSITGTTIIPNNVWHHVSVIGDSSGNTKLYIDGVEDASATLTPPSSNNFNFRIAAAGKRTITQLFRGNIDEVRVWNTALTVDQLRYLMNQELIEDASKISGVELPSTITKNEANTLNWSNLIGYYPMDTYTYTNVADMSGNNNRGALRNLNTVDFQSAPLPYASTNNSNWDTNSTWAYGTMQTIPGAPSIVNSSILIDWNIARIESDVTMDNSSLTNNNRTLLGLIINNKELTLPGSTSADGKSGTGNAVTVTHYLQLDGKLDLEGESQLIQTQGSDLDATTNGSLERDQQGTLDLFTYNYWSSPVGVNTTSYTISGILKDGTTASNPLPITFIPSGYNGTSGSPIGIADYWIWKFSNLTNDYSQWQHVKSTGSLLAGEGFTMKGVEDTEGSVSQIQNYVMEGIPFNGDINLPITAGNNYLVGNPYASALDADLFITDNAPLIEGAGGTTGTLYFWEHWGGDSHLSKEYQGGYASYNLSGGVPAVTTATSHPSGSNVGSGSKAPGRYIPIGQGFFVRGETSGNVRFRNSQRIFQKENATNSTFVRQAATTSTTNTDSRRKLRIGFTSPKTYKAQLLVTEDSRATIDVDWGFEGKQRGSQKENMYWMIDDTAYVIQGIDRISEATKLPLGLHTAIDGTITIHIDALENISDDVDVYLHDKDTDNFHNLRTSNFSMLLTAGDYMNRFEITFTKDPLLLITDESTLLSNVITTYFNNNKDVIVINNPKRKPIDAVTLFNVLGQEVAFFKTTSTQKTIELKTQKLSDGAYTIKIKSENNTVTKKVLVK